MPNGRDSAIEYLRANKDKFPLEVLRQKLAEAGYPKEVIDSAIMEVFTLSTGTGVVPPSAPRGGSFFDFKNVKVYRNFSEKLGDFLLGWLGGSVLFYGAFRFAGLPYCLYGISGCRFLSGFFSFGFVGIIIIIFVQIVGIFYFQKRRHYLTSGLRFAILSSPIILAVLVLGSVAMRG